ncbi:hypothetical protein BGZ46_006962 [Entomortierella lignicola]|nr:hypothetical protein BGZ46_006962 [Entomortierella lignicola]
MPATWSPTPLIPPFRFGTVEPEVYRGAYPKQRNLRFLKRLKLRTILSLVPDAPDAIFQEFCSQQGIRTIHLPVDKVKDNVPLTYNRAVEAVQIIIDQENLPIYIHCLDGASVTGLVVCCLRKLQTWNISSAMGEFLRYLRGGVISSEESVFVEKFSSEIEISKPIPLWLWEGQATFKKHPTLKLKFTIPPAAAAAAASNANNASITSPTLTTQNVLSTSPSHHGDGTNHNNNDTAITNGDSSAPGTVNGDSAVLGNSLNSNLSGSGQSGANSGSSAPSSIGLQNHANRILAKGSPLRDRITNSKTLVRTDISAFPGRTNSIATPTMAALSRNKRALGPGNAGALGQQQHQLLSEEPVSSDAAAPAAETGAKLINPVQASIPSGLGQSASETGEQSIAPHVISIVRNRRGSVSVQSGEHGTNTDANTEKESTAQGTEENTAVNSTLGAQDRNPNTSTVSKNSTTVTPSPVPVPVTEVADEYYEVSMTLKALALEGADF